MCVHPCVLWEIDREVNAEREREADLQMWQILERGTESGQGNKDTVSNKDDMESVTVGQIWGLECTEQMKTRSMFLSCMHGVPHYKHKERERGRNH